MLKKSAILALRVRRVRVGGRRFVRGAQLAGEHSDLRPEAAQDERVSGSRRDDLEDVRVGELSRIGPGSEARVGPTAR